MPSDGPAGRLPAHPRGAQDAGALPQGLVRADHLLPGAQVSLQKVGSQIQRIPEISTKKCHFLLFSFLMSSRSL